MISLRYQGQVSLPASCTRAAISSTPASLARGLVTAARVRRGRLLACNLDLRVSTGENPVARQIRTSLLSSLATEHFASTCNAGEAAFFKIFTLK